MISISKISNSFKQGKYRLFKVFQFGAKTADECSPFGFDGNPLEDMDAIFAETSSGGEPVIIGYIQTQRLANLGESRLFSLKEDGTLSTYIWLRNNNIIEFGGNDENLVKFSKLQEELTKLQNDINGELVKIASGITTAGGSYVPAQIQIDINESKTELIKIKGQN